MFSNLIFLILVLLLVSLAGELESPVWAFSPLSSFGLGIGLYILVLGVIFLQNRLPFRKNFLYVLANLELVVFLMIFNFMLGSQRIFQSIPFFENNQFLPAFFSLLLYFIALLVFHVSYARKLQNLLSSPSWQQIRLILPFVIPFLLFTLLVDLIVIVPSERMRQFLLQTANTTWGFTFVLIISFAFIGAMLILLPPLVVWIWQCKPMENSPLKERLERLCEKAHFKHGGILDWTILNDSLTAAIIGIIPRLRYVLFTKQLQRKLSPDSVEAVLAHEIGHNYHKHLLIYPFIILGMIFCTGLFSLVFSEAIAGWLNEQIQNNPSSLWSMVYPLTIFIPYALIIVVYFRYVFGFFSRQFERQADLYGIELGLSPEHMIKALDDVAIATGFTHAVPNWHHFSLQERIDFLHAAMLNPTIIQQHHRRVKYALLIYFSLLLLALLILIFPILGAIKN